MVSSELLTTLNDGPLASSIFPVHVTSIRRVEPFPSQGAVNVPGRAEPLGQSDRGVAAVALAVAVGAGALAEAAGVDAAGADDAALAAVVAPGGLPSDPQPMTAAAT